MAKTPRWKITSAINQKMNTLFERAAFGDPETQRDIAAQADKNGRREMAFRMAGTRDTKSRDYKTARDNIGRWLKGTRQPSAASRAKVASAGRSASVASMGAGTISARMHATFKVSETVWTGVAYGNLTSDAADAFAHALERGDTTGAAWLVVQAYDNGSGFADQVTSIEDITGLEIQ